jgi:hypothetical protein
VSGSQRVLDEVRRLAAEHAGRVSGRFKNETKPRVALLLLEASALAVREAAGEDTTTASIALRNSAAQLAREEMSDLQFEARGLALRAALAVIGAAL